jgi:hypothetical protein
MGNSYEKTAPKPVDILDKLCYTINIVNNKERTMSSIIPAKDVAGIIFKEIQAAVREEYGPDATAEEIRRAEWALAGALGAQMFTAKMA